MKKIFLVLTATVLFSCNKEADFTTIKKGLTSEQVVKLVGQPKEQKDIPFINAKFYLYEKNVVVFLNDSVTRCETKEAYAKEAEQKMGDMQQSIDSIDTAIKQLK